MQAAGRFGSPARQSASLGRGRRGGSASATAGLLTYASQMTGAKRDPFEQDTGGSGAGGGKMYKCPKCGKEFQQKGHFFGHMNSHLNVRPYSCDKCGKGFTYSQNLARHQKSCFTPSKYACTFCGVTCANAQQLQMHLIEAHADVS